jgi:hypothetical protein
LSRHGERLGQNATFQGEGFKEATPMATKKKAPAKKKAAKKKKH